MAFPLSILLIPYLIFLLLWIFFSFVGIFHLLNFGFKNLVTLMAIFIYVGVALFILIISINYINQIDWSFKIGLLNDIINQKLIFN
ncbi:hypothetical protein CO115_04515 [Candidatus Falkowbacteria bacterium CG_4_9_14_3_um_filter_36_9]|uniref:Transmembrane protein n=2 Tax=Candidatus Falkowiibacteriota TaxID=1752728 RepID=A0A1J4TA81_9BACT|nr:MAG: hypothetical protein AUJ27_01830 [Candidatus Falkowbacteria bacterium CG1_02_37_44]PIV52178.1 MAG: hypothetical protein COS18_00045 [Candidatus Falkowbacteria bacterium CG02_land_8_20_14_3_00_36_14]PJA10614.1 MAG: hypothetical protein COX67_04110 [Candidatus Falkowbacteria bacterium CG_4_10_14_0_2_um_filter_36_22]PJB18453.1 MAG: hypothetical protein CO115_04515 [Candidatus Falkowbacteria bacterium CG_4_9_14_3_um_filter_36_9]